MTNCFQCCKEFFHYLLKLLKGVRQYCFLSSHSQSSLSFFSGTARWHTWNIPSAYKSRNWSLPFFVEAVQKCFTRSVEKHFYEIPALRTQANSLMVIEVHIIRAFCREMGCCQTLYEAHMLTFFTL